MTMVEAPEWVMHNSTMLGVLESQRRHHFIAWIDTPHTAAELRDPSMEIAEAVMTDMMACLEPVGRTARRLLAADDPALADMGGILIDPQMGDRLIAFGVSPITLAAFTIYGMPQMLVTKGPLMGLTAHAHMDENAGGRTLAASLLLDQASFDMADNDVLVMKHSLPETIIAQAKGRRVDEIVSSPITDGLDLTIRRIDALPEGSTQIWLTERKPITLAQLAEDRGW
jgi:hypothetical protein